MSYNDEELDEVTDILGVDEDDDEEEVFEDDSPLDDDYLSDEDEDDGVPEGFMGDTEE